jgi:hypothetical protein
MPQDVISAVVVRDAVDMMPHHLLGRGSDRYSPGRISCISCLPQREIAVESLR